MNPSTALILILCAVPALFVAALFTWALCRMAAPVSVDDGRAFGGDDE